MKRVQWQITVEAETTYEAALKAQRIQRDPQEKPIFEVTDENGETSIVRLKHAREATADAKPTPRTRRPRLYLANEYGFSKILQAGPLMQIVNALTHLGFDVLEPFARCQYIDKSQPSTSFKINQRDQMDLRTADVFFAVINGAPPEEGIMVELGMAYALNKPVFLFRDDIRYATENDPYPINLMAFTGLPMIGWDQHLYSSIEELSNPDKALMRWIHAQTYTRTNTDAE